MAHSPKKHLGQHFLVDESFIERIFRVMQIKPQDVIFEIGPGQGALTKGLMQASNHFACVEYDPDLVLYLNKTYPELKVFHQDALTFDFCEHAHDSLIRIVGNLPYNISTPILFHLLKQSHCIKDLHLMLQKEVVARMCAAPGSKTFGRLSVMVQYVCKTTHLFDVPDVAFNPPPKVQSAVASLVPYTPEDCPFQPVDMEILNKITTAAFSKRRKTLRNSLKGILEPQEIESLELDLTARPETLSVSDFVALAKQLERNQKSVG